MPWWQPPLFAAGVTLLVVAAHHLWPYPRDGRAARQLGRKERAILAALGEALLPAGGEPPESWAEAGLVEYVDRYLGLLPGRSRLLLRLALRLVEHGAPLFFFALERMSRLEPEERRRYLAGWETSRLYLRRTVFLSLRAICAMAYLAHPGVARRIGLEAEEERP